MNKFLTKLCTVWMMTVFLAVCQAQEKNVAFNDNEYRGIVDFGDPNAIELKRRFLALENKSPHNNTLNIITFGDSHSAADFFTGKLRELLQNRFGDAGIGWISPMFVSGQNHTAVSWKTRNWRLFNSRFVTDKDFVMGGYIAMPIDNGSYLQVIPKNIERFQPWRVKMMIKPLKYNTIQAFDANNTPLDLKLKSNLYQWQSVNIITTMPLRIEAQPESVEIGSFWLQKMNRSGVILSSIAGNGAKLSIWQRWSPQWLSELSATQSDLVILEYGTNESFDSPKSIDSFERTLLLNIRHIRERLPKAAILLMSAPDTMLSKSTSENCQDRLPQNYQMIRKIQQSVAKKEKLLYWDWQTAMGGNCIIEKWYMLGLARSDYVHLTKDGYYASANILYRDLMQFVQ